MLVSGGSASRLDDSLGAADVAILLSFGLLLDGTSLESVSRWAGERLEGGRAAMCVLIGCCRTGSLHVMN